MPHRYQLVCPEDHRRIIDAYQDGRDYVAVAQELGVGRTTAWSVVVKWQRTGEATARPRGGNRLPKVDNEMRDLLVILASLDGLGGRAGRGRHEQRAGAPWSRARRSPSASSPHAGAVLAISQPN